MMLTTEQKRVRDLLTETVTLLCKNGLHFESELGIEALIGITLDKEEVFLVSIKETICSDKYFSQNALENFTNVDEVTEDSESASLSRTCLSGESFKGTQQSSHSHGGERKHRKNAGIEANCRKLSRTNSDTPKNGCVVTKAEEVDESVEILSCNYEVPRKRRRAEGSKRVSQATDTELKNNFDISSGSLKLNSTGGAEENATYGDNEQNLKLSHETCMIEIKRENTDDEMNSCLAIGSLYANSLDDLNGLSWKPEHRRLKRASEKTSLEERAIQYSSTPIWGTRSQVELIPGSQIFVNSGELQLIESETTGSRLIRRLVHAIFPDHCELASSCCLGLGGKQSRKSGLNQHKVDAIKKYVRWNLPHIPDQKVIRVINNLCCEARRKILRHGKRQDVLSILS